MAENRKRYVTCNVKALTSETVKHLKNHAIVHIVDRLSGGGKKKGQRKQRQAQEDQSGSSLSEADMLFEVMQRSCKTRRCVE